MLYKVMELGTDGWGVPDLKLDVHLTKEQAKERLDFYINEGVSPSRLKATPE
jgi:hypothetical protein|tara:strand:- start:345 stop:500 length:156 start_codon:yes stop_codon:yes gene_type:complete